LQVPLCEGAEAGAGDGTVARGGAGTGTGTCCTMVIGAGVGLETDAMHRRRPVTPTSPERIWIMVPKIAVVVPGGTTALIMSPNAGFTVALIM
jgi:hypothetical protein